MKARVFLSLELRNLIKRSNKARFPNPAVLNLNRGSAQNNLTLKDEQAVRNVRVRYEFRDEVRAEIELQGSKLPTKCKPHGD